MPQTVCEDRRWKSFLAHVRGSVDNRSYAAWFQRLRLHQIENHRLTAAVPNPFVKSYLEKNFRVALDDAARHCLGPEASLHLRYCAACGDEHESVEEPQKTTGLEGTGSSPSSAAVQPVIAAGSVPELFLNDRYVFDNFVVGPNNQLSHAACLQVISAPAVAYNPLFLHGASGLGKTHLLQATCRSLSDRNPGLRVLYVSCEEFMNRFVEALKQQTLDSFRRRLRRLDCLAVDDVHFLAGKKRMQEEFFHTFNALHDARKQIILSSDSKPDDMLDFEERLLTRFQWGLLTSMLPPPRETRVSIATRKSESLGYRLSAEVAEFLADMACSSVRAIEGMINKLVALAELYQRPLDLELAREALSDQIPACSVHTPSRIASEVASKFGVTVADLKSARRARRLLVPRQLAIYLTRTLTDASLNEIGGFFGGRDHSTVANALRRAEHLIGEDSTIRDHMDQIRSALHIH